MLYMELYLLDPIRFIQAYCDLNNTSSKLSVNDNKKLYLLDLLRFI